MHVEHVRQDLDCVLMNSACIVTNKVFGASSNEDDHACGQSMLVCS